MRIVLLVRDLLRTGIISGLLLASPLFAADGPPSTPASRVDQVYRDAKASYEAAPTNAVKAWEFARACFDQGEFAKTDSARAAVANEGILACRHALSSDPKLAAAHYYLGMDLAELARTKLIGALSLLGEIETEWKTAIKLDEKFDYAGPDRNLGALYRDAPDWPLSIGSRANARQHLMRAVRISPEYPENHINLIEAYIKWNNHAEAQAAAKKLAEILPEARKKFSGPDWESTWADWDRRWKIIQTELKRSVDLTPPHIRK